MAQVTSSDWKNPLPVTVGAMKSNLVADANGNMFVIDAPINAAGAAFIRKISPAGAIIATISTASAIACGASAQTCTSLAMDSNGNFYFSTDLSTITAVSSATGSVTASSAIPNLWFFTNNNDASGPGMVCDSNNNLYFSTSDTSPSIVVHRSGNPASRSTVFSLPSGSSERFFSMAVLGTTLYALSSTPATMSSVPSTLFSISIAPDSSFGTSIILSSAQSLVTQRYLVVASDGTVMVHGGSNLGCKIFTLIGNQFVLVAFSDWLYNSNNQPSNAGFLVASSVGPIATRYTLVTPLASFSGMSVSRKDIGTVKMQSAAGQCPAGA